MSVVKKAIRKLPLGFRKKVRKYLKFIKGEYEYSRRPITQSEIIEDLGKLGVKPGDIIYVQSSLKSIGKVKGGAEAVIDALISAVGPEGTVAMPAFSIPVGGMKETLERNEVFDPASTPSTVGFIPETFRKRAGVLRSIHPTSSIAAYGAKAKMITEGHNKAPSNFGVGTPYWKIIENSGKTIGIGVELDKVSFYHTAEDVIDPFPIRVYINKKFQAKISEGGNITTMDLKALDPVVSRTRIDNIPDGDWIRNLITEYLIDRGTVKYGYIGDAKTWIMTAENFFESYEKLVKDKITIYTTEEEYNKRGKQLISYIRNHRSSHSDKHYDYLNEQLEQITRSYKDKGFWDPVNKNWIRQLNWDGKNWSGHVPHDWKYALELQEGASQFALLTGDSTLDKYLKHELKFIHSKVKEDGSIEGIPDGVPVSSEEYEYGAALSCLALGWLIFNEKDAKFSKMLMEDLEKVYEYMSDHLKPLFEDHRSVIIRGYANLMAVYRHLNDKSRMGELKSSIQSYADEFVKAQLDDGLFPFSPAGYKTALQCQLKAELALLMAYKATNKKEYLVSARKNFDWVIRNLLQPNGGLKWNVNNSENFFEIHQMLFLICARYLHTLSNGKYDYMPYAISAWKFLLDDNPADIDMYVHNYRTTGAFFSYRCVDHDGAVQKKTLYGGFKGTYELGYTFWALALNEDMAL